LKLVNIYNIMSSNKIISWKALKENSREQVCIQRVSGWWELIAMVFESIPELLIGNNSKIRRKPTLQDWEDYIKI